MGDQATGAAGGDPIGATSPWRSSRWPTAARASRGGTATSSSSRVGSPVTKSVPRSPRRSAATPRRRLSSWFAPRRIGSRRAAITAASRVRGPWQGLARRAAPAQAAAGRGRPGSPGRARVSSSSRARRGAVALSQQARCSFGERDGELVLGFHARGRWTRSSTPRTADSPPSETDEMRNDLRAWAQAEALPAHAGARRLASSAIS